MNNPEIYHLAGNKSFFRMGIILNPPFLKEISVSDNYIIILDENNIMWFALKSTLMNLKELTPFGLVCFKFNERQEITFIWVFNQNKKLSYKWRLNIHELQNKDSRYYPNKYPIDFLSNVSFRFDDITYKTLFCDCESNKFSFDRISYHINKSEEIIDDRFFLVDEFTKSYQETNKQFANVIRQWFDGETQSELPIKGEEIKGIIDTINNFNPYEVFESYNIKITYSRIRRGRDSDDLYIKYKTYRINYFDDYLSKWFRNGDYELKYETSYSTPYMMMNDNDPDYADEINFAKARAYAEYNKQEHFDCLFAKYHLILKDRMKLVKSGKAIYPDYIWIPYLKIKEAYAHLDKALILIVDRINRKSLRNTDEIKPIYEERISEAIERFNIISLLEQY